MATAETAKKQRSIIRAWCMYDWANSGFATSGIAAILPVYFVYLFKDALGEEVLFLGISFTGSSVWSLAGAISTAIVALTSPIIGVIADRVAIKKTLLWIYMTGGSLFTVLAFFSAYTPAPWAWLLGTFMLGNIGFAGSLVFYNSLLPHIAPNRESLDDISSRGFAYGYIGGGLLLLIHLGLNMATSGTDIADLVTRISLGSIGIWWFFWAIWTLKVVPEPPVHNEIKGLNARSATRMAISELKKTFRELRRFRVISIYLMAYLLFNDGIQTVMAIAGAFAADTLGISLTFNMLTILIIQFVAAGGAMGFSRLAYFTTTKGALTVSLIGWVFIVIMGIAIAPLEPAHHSDHDYQLEYHAASNSYRISAAPELDDSYLDRKWIDRIGDVPVGEMLHPDNAQTFMAVVANHSDSQYTASAIGGPLNKQSVIGDLHPSSLGSGPLDWWPTTIRDILWKPIGLQVGYQWLLLGVCVGLVMGGSQALARSLFAQIAPQSRSGEFFSFFGFMSRASSVIGPMLYVIVTGMLDTRAAVFSILLIIVAGVIVLRWVDVEAGIQVADDEDKKRWAT